jgi:hypothetical protein
MKLFHAERCYGASNFKAEMTIRQDQGICVNQCNVAKERGECDYEIGKCICYEGWEGADCGKQVGGGAPEKDEGDCAISAIWSSASAAVLSPLICAVPLFWGVVGA